MRLEDVKCPVPGEKQVLIDVRAVSVNPYDWHYLRGTPGFFRLSAGFTRPKNTVLGSDVAGVVREVGPGVKAFKRGDEVFGAAVLGAFAESACAEEDHLAVKPVNMTFDQSASAPMAGLTALQALRYSGQIRKGETVLVNGASGGVGTFAVQIAKALGAVVTGVCGSGNLEMVKSIGADIVIDYTRSDLVRTGQKYDLVLDTVGSLSLAKIRVLLSPGGRAVVIGYTSMRRILHIGLAGGRSVRLMTADTCRKDLERLRELLESGKVMPVIDRRYSFADLPTAIDYLETGHARGKVVVTL
jgi:NADPH:quinone reductase-like Zn-dependent oxidoreductase